METVITVQEEAIDWITCTCAQGNNSERLACLAERVVAQQMEDGYERGPWNKYGYMGEAIEGLSWGVRRGGTLLRLSGFLAARYGWEAIACADNVSRLDVQVTVRTEPPVLNVARDGYAELIRAGANGRKGASCSYLTNSGGGSTTYLGRRQSDKYFRLYDKWRESDSDHYAGSWRYELEVKNEPALDLARYLAASPDRQRAIRDTVHGYCTGHGLTPLYGGSTEGMLLEAPRPPTGFDRTCKWLSEQVRASAQRVVYEQGIPALLRLLEIDQTERNWRTKGPHRPHGNHDDDDDGNVS